MKARRNIGVVWWSVGPGVSIKRQGGGRIVPQCCKVSSGLVVAAAQGTAAGEGRVPAAAWVVPLNSLASESVVGFLGIASQEAAPFRKGFLHKAEGQSAVFF